MRRTIACMLLAAAVAGPALAQPSPAPHIAAAKAAAGSNFVGVFNATCGPETPAAAPAPAAPRTAGPPPRSEWYAPPQKVFDNLYWLGTKEHSSWALTTSGGIILIDTLYNFAAEAEIVDGLKTLGLDPKTVKYVIVSHGHGDHDQGAKMMQDRFGSHIVMGGPDWDTVEKSPNMPGGAPKRDIVVNAVQPLTLGDTTVTIIPTPGHTLGTLSLIFPVKDHGKTLTVAYSGGTAFNFAHTAERFDTYIASQQKFARAAADAKATVVLSNHSVFDHALEKAAMKRSAGQPSPFEVGAAGVAGYVKTLEECAVATRIKEYGR